MAPTVPEYYAGKNVLISGATGFLGKALVEKLLRCCPDIDTVYLLLRQKKGMSSEERLRDLCNNRLFELLRSQNPDAFKKLKLIAGDILENELGLSLQDKEELNQRCNIVFHSAACVRFDQKLKDAVNLNITGTLRMLKLAESMQHLEAFIHLSTAYCRCELDKLEEKLYPAMHKPHKIIDLVEWMDDKLLDHLEPKIIGLEPNTYSYTKAITEDLVDEFSKKFPTAIARPSIVTAALKEPTPGWVDNLNGPTGLIIGSAKGIIRTMHCEPSYHADAVPVDCAVNGCILIGYATGLDRPKETEVYNITLSRVIHLSWGELIEMGKKWVNAYPPTVALWYPGGNIKSYWITHQICMYLFHIFPAYLVDALLFILGRKTFMVNLQKRICHGLEVIQYYTTKEWYFINTKYQSLRDRISKEDNEIFYTDLNGLDPDEYLKNYIIGSREYVCKEDPSTLPRAKKLHKIRYIVDLVFKMLFIYLFACFLYNRLYIITNAVGYLDDTLKNIYPFGLNSLAIDENI